MIFTPTLLLTAAAINCMMSLAWGDKNNNKRTEESSNSEKGCPRQIDVKNIEIDDYYRTVMTFHFREIKQAIEEPNESSIKVIATRLRNLNPIYDILLKNEISDKGPISILQFVIAKSELFKINFHEYWITSTQQSQDADSDKQTTIEQDKNADEGILGLLEYYAKSIFIDNDFNAMHLDYVCNSEWLKNADDTRKRELHNILILNHLKTLTSPQKNFGDLVGEAGKAYDNIVDIYEKLGLIDNVNRLDHNIVYEIADFIIKNTSHYFCRGLSVDQMAEEITSSIIRHVNTTPEALKDLSDPADSQTVMRRLFDRYMPKGEIAKYPMFLERCRLIYKSAMLTPEFLMSIGVPTDTNENGHDACKELRNFISIWNEMKVYLEKHNNSFYYQASTNDQLKKDVWRYVQS